jgi:hypothetical protein
MPRHFITGLLALAALSAPALAHHGWGSYDAEKPMELTATIDEMTLGNPHGMLMLAQDGTMWNVTLAPPSRMNARGATGDIVKQGAEVKAYGYPKRTAPRKSAPSGSRSAASASNCAEAEARWTGCGSRCRTRPSPVRAAFRPGSIPSPTSCMCWG